jgi:hypothetical protein
MDSGAVDSKQGRESDPDIDLARSFDERLPLLFNLRHSDSITTHKTDRIEIYQFSSSSQLGAGLVRASSY